MIIEQEEKPKSLPKPEMDIVIESRPFPCRWGEPNMVLGHYKGAPVRLEILHVAKTYRNHIEPYNLKLTNLEILNVEIDKQSAELFGLHVPYHVFNDEPIDYAEKLSPIIVYAYLSCWSPIKKGDGSHMALAWLQDTCRVFGTPPIKWDQHARDFEL